MQRLPQLILAGGLAAIVVACAATLMPVGSHIQRGVDFTRYRTYDWGPPDALPASDARLRDNPFFVDDVHGAIDIELGRRGLVRATAEPADLLVHYHAAVTGRLEEELRPEPFRDCVGDDCRPTVTDYEAGTLVIDIVERSTNRVIWRGWAEHRLEDMLGDPDLVLRRIQNAVRRVMETLPLPVETQTRVAAPEATP